MSQLSDTTESTNSPNMCNVTQLIFSSSSLREWEEKEKGLL